MATDKFPCNGCGACCRAVGQAVVKFAIPFPFKVSEAGVCEQLDENNKCKVYDQRPDICNIDKMIEMQGMDKELGYRVTVNACNTLIAREGGTNFIKLCGH